MSRFSDRTALRQAVDGCLIDLGDSPGSVAERLQGLGVRGLAGRADECPMSRYLRAVLGPEESLVRIDVLEKRLRVSRKLPRLPLSVALPPAVRAFVHDFDAGHFPQLLDGPATASDPPVTSDPR
ncbi:MAG: hypothetical protein KGQ66_14890 [Acidobacteriota bacterium]|nr:hypothetical protein [Acidobacteriota bacterium]